MQAHRGVFNESCCHQLIAHGVEMALDIPLQVHENDIVFAVTQISLLDMLHLLVNYRCANDEYDGNRKLANHKTPPDENASESHLQFRSLQYFHGIKRRQIKSRIGSCNQSCDQAYSQ